MLDAGLARAQMGPHGLPPQPRPLHERLEQADVVAIGTVERVELGRIAVRDAVALRGAPGERFRVKRDPSQPPEVEAGDRVLWILRGARGPFVLVDEPREVLVLEDPAGARRLAAALGDLEGAESRADLRELYVTWLEGEDPRLREHALQALTDPRARAAAAGALLTPQLARDRARAALETELPEAARLASARVAIADPAGLELLLAGVERPDAHPEVVKLALGVGLLLGGHAGAPPAGVATAVLEGLEHPNPQVREAAAGSAAALMGEPRVREILRRLAAEDPAPAVRARAEQVLKRVDTRPTSER